MYIGLLGICTIASFGESLISNSKSPIKCVPKICLDIKSFVSS